MAESKQPTAARHLRNPSQASASTLKQPAPAAPLTNWTGPSNIATFVRCVRLLNLDQRADWPNITAQTFSTKASQQNLQYRVKAVEWALYRLFEIWDPEETGNKLRPFFPPLEPLQSLNLRAALFRCLTDVKKNGVLGREVVLRKTMLDECKGERFEEVLASFALAVLRKVVTQKDILDGSAVAKLALSTSLTSAEQQLLFPLVLAHRVSLSRELDEKNDLRQLFGDFEKLLRLKEAQVHKRSLIASEESKKQAALDEDEVYQIHRAFKRSWHGDEQWSDIMLGKESKGNSDQFLGSNFQDLWEHVREGTVEDLQVDPPRSLLDDLESRIAIQQQRLQKWKDYQQSISLVEEQVERPKPVEHKKPAFTFDDHRQLTVGSKLPARPASSESLSSPSKQLYQGLIESMQKELANLRPNKAVKQPKRHAELQSQHSSKLALGISPIKDGMKPLLLSRISTDKSKELSLPPSLSPKVYDYQHDKGPSRLLAHPIRSPLSSGPTSPQVSTFSPSHTGNFTRSPRSSYFEPNQPPTPSAAPSSPWSPASPAFVHNNEAMSPPPRPQVSRSQSLAQRRFPVAVSSQPRTSSEKLDKNPANPLSSDRISTPPISPKPLISPQHRASTFGPPIPPSPSISTIEDSPPKPPSRSTSDLTPTTTATLLERTRQSMSLLPHTNGQHPRQSLAPKGHSRHQSHNPRQSQIFPINQFETPRKRLQSPSGADSQSSTPREELFSQEADYASVFKSRPRIGMSPGLSPSGKKGGGVAEEDVGLEEMEDLSLGDITTVGSSPLKGY